MRLARALVAVLCIHLVAEFEFCEATEALFKIILLAHVRGHEILDLISVLLCLRRMLTCIVLLQPLKLLIDNLRRLDTRLDGGLEELGNF